MVPSVSALPTLNTALQYTTNDGGSGAASASTTANPPVPVLGPGSILPLPTGSAPAPLAHPSSVQPQLQMIPGHLLNGMYPMGVPLPHGLPDQPPPMYISAGSAVSGAQVVFQTPIVAAGNVEDPARRNSYDSNNATSPTSNTSEVRGLSVPAGKLTTTLWDDEGTVCYQVECKNICVARRRDNNMVNGTKLLNVVGMTRGKRDGILKNERHRLVVKVGSMHLKGVWIPFERAKALAEQYNVARILYPLFEPDPTPFLFNMNSAVMPIAQGSQPHFIPQSNAFVIPQYTMGHKTQPQLQQMQQMPSFAYPVMQGPRPMYTQLMPSNVPGVALQAPMNVDMQQPVAYTAVNGGYIAARPVYAYPQLVYAQPAPADTQVGLSKSFSAYPALTTPEEATHPSSTSTWSSQPPPAESLRTRSATIATLPLPGNAAAPFNANGKRNYSSMSEGSAASSNHSSPINTSSMQLAVGNTPPTSATIQPSWPSAPEFPAYAQPGPLVTPCNSRSSVAETPYNSRPAFNSTLPPVASSAVASSAIVQSRTTESTMSSGGFSTSSSLASYVMGEAPVLDQPSSKRHRSSLTNPVDLAVAVGGLPLSTHAKPSTAGG